MNSARGVSSVELVVATLILAAALVPIYSIFVKGTTTVTHSRISYMALHAAREELEELRQIPFDQLAEHGWQAVEGNVFRRTLAVRSANPATNPLSSNPQLAYQAEYKRIFTKLQLKATEPADPRMKVAVLDVRWQEKGAGTEVQKEATSHFETIIASHNVER